MKTPQHPTIRVFGQRSIAPSFLNRGTNPAVDSGDNQTKKAEKSISFSDFLDRKLNKSVVYKPITEERRMPFTALVSPKDLAEPSHGFETKTRAREEVKSGDVLGKTELQRFKSNEKQTNEEVESDVLNIVNLDQLKQNDADKTEHMSACAIGIDEDILVKEEHTSRKRKDPFEGMDVKDRNRKPVLVLGGKPEGSNPIRKRRERTCSKRHRPAYNHYANGSGWWDCDMEGVDSEEVGYGEVWEGVGSTTFGDIVDWH